MTYTNADLEKHLQQEHSISPFSTYLKEIVYGGNDGIVTTFAVVAGFAGANMSAHSPIGYLTVLLFGLANLAADATSMGLGNFLSMRSEQDRYKKERDKEAYEVEQHFELEKAETVQLLQNKGFSQTDALELVKLYSKNKDYWIDFMMKYELNMNDPNTENAFYTALATFFSFIVFGFIPLIPYIFFPTFSNPFLLAMVSTGIALLLLGLLRYKITKDSWVRSVGEIMLIGGISAVIAYSVGTFFKL